MVGKEAVEFFNLLFDEGVKTQVFDETTRFAQQFIEQNAQFLKDHPRARAHDWIRRPMKPKEVDALLALFIAMGIVGYPTLR